MGCELYLLTPPRVAPDFPETLQGVLAAGPVGAVQIRLKDHDPVEAERLAAAIVPVVRAAGAAAIVNDDPALAARLKADGVHVGQEDATIAEARAALGREAIVGATCHDSRHLAMIAGEQGADYVAFGSVYDTVTKTPKSRASLEIIEWWSELFEIPCVAIGGITPENAEPVIRAGADYLAVCGGVWSHPQGPQAAVRAFSSLLR